MQRTSDDNKNVDSMQSIVTHSDEEETIFVGEDDTAAEEEFNSSHTTAPTSTKDDPHTEEEGSIDADDGLEDEDGDQELSKDSEESVFKVLIRALDIDGQWFKRNKWFIFWLTICLLAYVTNRYQAQEDEIKVDKLRAEQKDMRYKALTKRSELTLKTRQSNIEKILRQNGDTTLRARSEAPFIIKVPKEQQSNGKNTETTR